MQASATDTEVDEHDQFNCMEVWGGNGATNSHFSRPGLDVWINSQPQAPVVSGGGDLHLLSSCASGRITRMLIADVCGFDSLFSEIAAELSDLLKSNANSIQQANAVSRLSSRLSEASHRGGFASTMLSTYFAPTRSFSLCNVGHVPPLLFRAATQEWSILKQSPTDLAAADNSPGVVAPDEYQQFKTKLQFDDMVLSYSNAFAECRSTTGTSIGLTGLLKRVRQLETSRPADFVTKLVTQLRSEHSDNLAMSDSTVLLCRASETTVRWQDNVFAPFRLLRSVTDKTQIC